MAGKCKRRMVRFGKAAARFLGPALGPVIPMAVNMIEMLSQSVPDLFDGHQKRRMVFAAVATEAKKIGHEAYDGTKNGLSSMAESYVRAALESALYNLREGKPLEELQDWATDPDLQDADDD